MDSLSPIEPSMRQPTRSGLEPHCLAGPSEADAVYRSTYHSCTAHVHRQSVPGILPRQSILRGSQHVPHSRPVVAKKVRFSFAVQFWFPSEQQLALPATCFCPLPEALTDHVPCYPAAQSSEQGSRPMCTIAPPISGVEPQSSFVTALPSVQHLQFGHFLPFVCNQPPWTSCDTSGETGPASTPQQPITGHLVPTTVAILPPSSCAHSPCEPTELQDSLEGCFPRNVPAPAHAVLTASLPLACIEVVSATTRRQHLPKLAAHCTHTSQPYSRCWSQS